MNEPTVSREALFELHTDIDVAVARRGVRDWAAELGLSMVDLTKVVTAASELARNAVIHGGGGEMCLQIVTERDRQGLRMMFRDNGPGIAEVDRAMQDGYSTGRGMGLGLPGARRLVNEFALASTPSEGTCVTIIRWKK
ncbi:MAG TPA: anti-sigma regulatory factor [Gemmatimonadaceae bacterium]|nr:anti-sigma regulatory factor [Gemmatimonadaceae bacterium]